jgi:hypothetical protein
MHQEERLDFCEKNVMEIPPGDGTREGWYRWVVTVCGGNRTGTMVTPAI